jgi:hypothetical protein
MNNCPNCGPYDCYHICPNSPHYYSPEQERADDAFYGDDDNRERYAATIETSQYADVDDQEYAAEEADAFFADREPGSVTEEEYQAKVSEFMPAPIGTWVHPVDAGIKADDFSDDIPF